LSGPRELSETMERYRKPGTRSKTNVQTYTFVPSWTIATYLAFYSTVNQGMVVEKQSVLSRRSCRRPVVERTSDHHVIHCPLGTSENGGSNRSHTCFRVPCAAEQRLPTWLSHQLTDRSERSATAWAPRRTSCKRGISFAISPKNPSDIRPLASWSFSVWPQAGEGKSRAATAVLWPLAPMLRTRMRSVGVSCRVTIPQVPRLSERWTTARSFLCKEPRPVKGLT
jgi:hypothetical protein